jgi:hypothetical protein
MGVFQVKAQTRYKIARRFKHFADFQILLIPDSLVLMLFVRTSVKHANVSVLRINSKWNSGYLKNW